MPRFMQSLEAGLAAARVQAKARTQLVKGLILIIRRARVACMFCRCEWPGGARPIELSATQCEPSAVGAAPRRPPPQSPAPSGAHPGG